MSGHRSPPEKEPGTFTLREDLAEAFISRAAARYGSGDEPHGSAGGRETVALGPAWNPAGTDAWDMRTAESLIDEAVSSGVIATPAEGWSVRLDLVYDIHGSVFLWRVTLPGDPPCSLASPEWQDARRLGNGAAGAEAALELLREAERSANVLYAAWTGPR